MDSTAGPFREPPGGPNRECHPEAMNQQQRLLPRNHPVRTHDGWEQKVSMDLFEEPLWLKDKWACPRAAIGCGVHPLVEKCEVLAPLRLKVLGVSDVDPR